MTSKKTKNKNELLDYVTSETVGPDAVPIVDYLINKKNISEFVIAKDLGIEIHKIRQLLYKLLEDSVVTFIRKKDKIKGWYICYWSLNDQEINFIAKKLKQKKLDLLKERLNKEKNNKFFMCKNACTRVNFDDAFDMNFKCPDCGELMHEQNNERTISFLENKISELQKEIEEIDNKIMLLSQEKSKVTKAKKSSSKTSKKTEKAKKTVKTNKTTKSTSKKNKKTKKTK